LGKFSPENWKNKISGRKRRNVRLRGTPNARSVVGDEREIERRRESGIECTCTG